MAAPPPVFAALLTDRLQGPRLGYLLGLQNIGFGMGAMGGPLLAGVLFDRLRGYAAVSVLMVACVILASVILFASDNRPLERAE